MILRLEKRTAVIIMKEYDLLKIRGYIGISLIGKTTYWTRVKE